MTPIYGKVSATNPIGSILRCTAGLAGLLYNVDLLVVISASCWLAAVLHSNAAKMEALSCYREVTT